MGVSVVRPEMPGGTLTERSTLTVLRLHSGRTPTRLRIVQFFPQTVHWQADRDCSIVQLKQYPSTPGRFRRPSPLAMEALPLPHCRSILDTARFRAKVRHRKAVWDWQGFAASRTHPRPACS